MGTSKTSRRLLLSAVVLSTMTLTSPIVASAADGFSVSTPESTIDVANGFLTFDQQTSADQKWLVPSGNWYFSVNTSDINAGNPNPTVHAIYKSAYGTIQKLVFNGDGDQTLRGDRGVRYEVQVKDGQITLYNGGSNASMDIPVRTTQTTYFKDVNGKDISDPFVQQTAIVGQHYTTAAKDIDGYTLVDTPINASGTVSNQKTTYIVGTTTTEPLYDDYGNQWAIATKTITDEAGSVTETLQVTDSDGNPRSDVLTPSENGPIAPGAYGTFPKLSQYGAPYGTLYLTNHNIEPDTVTYTYKKKTGSANIILKTPDGDTIRTEQTITGNYGDTPDFTAPDIPGYTLTKQPTTLSPLTDTDTPTYEYVYTPNTEKVTVKAMLIDENGKPVKDLAITSPAEQTGDYNTKFTVGVPTLQDPDNYEYAGAKTNTDADKSYYDADTQTVHGIYDEQTSTVTFYFREKPQPTEPATPTTPTEPAVPTTPAEPTTPTTPTQPAEPATPTTPAEPSKPAEPVTPAQPEKPVTPTKPADPTTPATPTKPTEPTTPVTPKQPTKNPDLTPKHVEKSTITVNYVTTDKTATPKPSTITKTGTPGGNYTFNVPNKPGYTPVINVNGKKYTGNDNTVTFPNDGKVTNVIVDYVPNKDTIIVHHVDADTGKNVAADVTLTGLTGEDATAKAYTNLKGYTVKGETTQTTTFGPDGQKELTFKYTKKTMTVTIQPVTRDKNGNLVDIPGQKHTIEVPWTDEPEVPVTDLPDIPYYTRDKDGVDGGYITTDGKTVKVDKTTTPPTIQVEYTPNRKDPVVNEDVTKNSDVTGKIVPVDPKGNELTPNDNKPYTDKPGTELPTPTVPGYTTDTPKVEVPVGGGDITVVYTKVPDTPADVTGKIVPVDPKGNELTPNDDKTYTDKPGTELPTPTVPGYTTDTTKVEVPVGGGDITVVYTKVPDTPAAPAETPATPTVVPATDAQPAPVLAPEHDNQNNAALLLPKTGVSARSGFTSIISVLAVSLAAMLLAFFRPTRRHK